MKCFLGYGRYLLTLTKVKDILQYTVKYSIVCILQTTSIPIQFKEPEMYLWLASSNPPYLQYFFLEESGLQPF